MVLDRKPSDRPRRLEQTHRFGDDRFRVSKLREIVDGRRAIVEHEIEFFTVHIEVDEVHGERGYEIVLNYANTPELQQACIEAVRDAADMRFSYTKALYDYYVRDSREATAA